MIGHQDGRGAGTAGWPSPAPSTLAAQAGSPISWGTGGTTRSRALQSGCEGITMPDQPRHRAETAAQVDKVVNRPAPGEKGAGRCINKAFRPA